MNRILFFLPVILLGTFASGQTMDSAGTCEKSTSFAVTEGGQPVPAVPGFTEKWVGAKKHQQKYSGLCFSQTPDAKATSYVVIFSTSESSFVGLIPTVQAYISTTSVSGSGMLTNSYGGIWHYTYTGVPAKTTTTTLDLFHVDTSTSLFARAYSQQGEVISRRSLKDVSGWFHTKDKLLDLVMDDIRADSSKPAQKSSPVAASPLSVYYVNCDVPSELPVISKPTVPIPEIAKAAKPEPAPAPDPEPILDILSKPPGADIYVDGAYAGKTPLSVQVSPGTHAIALRKQNFRNWQTAVEAAPGHRKVAAEMEQERVTVHWH